MRTPIPDARIALPVSVSREAERIAGRARRDDHLDEAFGGASHGGRAAGGVDFAASQEGGFIWPDFLPAYDAAATLVHLLDLLAAAERTVVVGRRARCRATHVAHETVPTPWERKGAVMRGDGASAPARRDVVLVDGVKIVYPDGWALVLPDPEDGGHARVGRGASDAEAAPPRQRSHAGSRPPSSRQVLSC